jgi:hypothetical protein
VVGWVGWLEGWLVAGCFAGWLAGWLAGWVDWWVSWPAGRPAYHSGALLEAVVEHVERLLAGVGGHRAALGGQAGDGRVADRRVDDLRAELRVSWESVERQLGVG